MAWIIDAVDSNLFRNFIVLLALIVAIISVASAASTAKKKQTADMIFSTRKDDQLREGLIKIAEIHKKTDANIRKFALDPDCEETAKTSGDLRYVLNHFEYVSVGIQANIYDENMLRKAQYGIVVSLYEQINPFIKEIRLKSGRITVWQEFEWLACRWKEKELKKTNIKTTANKI